MTSTATGQCEDRVRSILNPPGIEFAVRRTCRMMFFQLGLPKPMACA